MLRNLFNPYEGDPSAFQDEIRKNLIHLRLVKNFIMILEHILGHILTNGPGPLDHIIWCLGKSSNIFLVLNLGPGNFSVDNQEFLEF